VTSLNGSEKKNYNSNRGLRRRGITAEICGKREEGLTKGTGQLRGRGK